MSFSVNVRLGEVSASTSLSELSASVTISGGLLRSIPFSADKDTELEFADTITFSVDNPSPDVEYIWRLEDGQGTNTKLGTQVKQDYTSEGQYDVKVLGHYLDQQRLEGVGYKKDFVKVDFDIPLQLLDDVPGAAAAYSIRLLRSAYSDGLLRVRAVDSNGIDQGEADVQDLPLSDGRYIDLNSPIENLDSTAQGRGLLNSDTLGDLVDSGGANYDGFMPKWYDQSPNARHGTNSTASEQPQLVDAGSLIKENGKPAINFLNNTFLVVSFSQQYAIPFTYFLVIKQRNLNNTAEIIDSNNQNSPRSLLDISGTNYRLFNGSSFNTGFQETSNQNFIYALFNGAQSEAQLNKQAIAKGDSGTGGLNKNISIGKSSNFFQGYMQEVVIYPNSQRSNLNIVRAHLDGFYELPNL